MDQYQNSIVARRTSGDTTDGQKQEGRQAEVLVDKWPVRVPTDSRRLPLPFDPGARITLEFN